MMEPHIPSPFTPGHVIVRRPRDQIDGIKGRQLSDDEYKQVEHALDVAEAAQDFRRLLSGIRVEIREFEVE